MKRSHQIIKNLIKNGKNKIVQKILCANNYNIVWKKPDFKDLNIFMAPASSYTPDRPRGSGAPSSPS